MEKTKQKFKMKILVAILATLLISSTLVIFLNVSANSTVSADVSPAVITNALSNRISPLTGQPYGDLAQYDWPHVALTWATSDRPECTKFSAGPAPSTANVLWSLPQEAKAVPTGGMAAINDLTQLGIPTRGIPDAWINGLVLIRSQKNSTISSYTPNPYGAPTAVWSTGAVYALNALDPYTGRLVWQILLPNNVNTAPMMLDATHFRLNEANTAQSPITGRTWMVYNTADGTFAYNITNAPNTNNIFWDVQVAVSTSTGPDGTGTILQGWNLANVNTGSHTVTSMWNFTNPGGGANTNCYGEGRMFLISWGDEYIRALNVVTGKMDWQVLGPTNLRDGIYYNHKVYCAGIGQFLITYDGATGKKIWEWSDLYHRAYFANAGCAGYGMFFSLVLASPQCYFAAWDDATGKLLWKVPAASNIAYYNPVMGDGKVYCVMSDGRGISSLTYLPAAFSACMDAFTGETLWTVPFTFGTGSNTATGGFRGDLAVAYGSFWYEQDKVLYCINDLPSASLQESMFLGSATTPGVSIGVPAAPDIAYPKWTYKTGGPVISSPTVVNGILYEGSADGQIYALDSLTGVKIWNFTTGYRVRSTVAVSGGVVYTGTDDGYMYALNANNGQQIWKKTDLADRGLWKNQYEFTTGSEGIYRSSPIIAGGRIYVGSLNSYVYCINPSSGATVWSFKTGGPVAGSAAIDKGIVYIESTEVSTGKLYALNAATGTQLWNLTIPSSGNSLFSTPMIGGDYIFLGPGADTAGLRIINKSNGTFTTFSNGTAIRIPETGTTPRVYTPVYYGGDLWNTTTANPTKLYTPMGVIFTSGGFRIECWNVSAILAGVPNSESQRGYTLRGTLSGVVNAEALIWQTWIGHEVYSSTLLTTGQDGAKIYVGSDIGSITCFDAATGQVESNFATSGRCQSNPAVYNGMVFVGHSDFNIYAFGWQPVVPITVAAGSASQTASSGSAVTINVRVYSEQPYKDYAYNTVENLFPPIRNASVTVTVTRPDGTSQALPATTDTSGATKVTFTPTAAGTYKVAATYGGLQYFGYSYSPAASTSTFTVAGLPAPTPSSSSTPSPSATATVTATPAPSAVVTPTPTPAQTTQPTSTAAPTAEPTSTPTTTTPSNDMTIIIVAVVVVIILLAAGAFVYMQRRKK